MEPVSDEAVSASPPERVVIVVEFVETETGGNWAAYAPDWPGCVATAETWRAVLEAMREALSDHLSAIRGYPVPKDHLRLEIYGPPVDSGGGN